MRNMSRRRFAGTVLGSTAAGILAQETLADSAEGAKILVVGVACSPRKGMTTTQGVSIALKAAAEVDARIETKLMDLGGMRIAGWSPDIQEDDFSQLLPTLRSKQLGGLIVGSPVYFRTMSALCKAFIERLAALRKPRMLLADKPAGALSVGAYRNGGQELVISEIHRALLCHEAVIVGGREPAFQGATLLNSDDSIVEDGLGRLSAEMLGKHIAQAALDRE